MRSYSTTPQIWGGSPDCDHQLTETAPGKVLTGGTGPASAKQVTNAGSQYGNAWGPELRGKRADLLPREESNSQSRMGTDERQGIGPPSGGRVCTRCGAWRGELGSEPTPQLYVEHIVEVFRAVRRVLHDTGTIWVNLGDSYSGSGKGGNGGWAERSAAHRGGGHTQDGMPYPPPTHVPGLGPKQLLMMPARVALALQSDGWVLRSDIIWSKPNPMPESVNDRPTKAHEYIFLLAKQPNYYFDSEAVREGVQRLPANIANHSVLSASQSPQQRIGAMSDMFSTTDTEMAPATGRQSTTSGSRHPLPSDAAGQEHETSARYLDTEETTASGIPADTRGASGEPSSQYLGCGAGAIGSVLQPPTDGEGWRGDVDGAGVARHQGSAAEPMRLLWDGPSSGNGPCDPTEPGRHPHEAERSGSVPDVQRTEGRAGRNLRSVWTLSTESFQGAHFATFPRKLVEPCVLSGSSARGQCPACGAPWRRVVAREANGWHECPKDEGRRAQGLQSAVSGLHSQYREVTTRDAGWAPTCACAAGDPVPQVCLDPFLGSGTTAYVARHHGRRAVGIELNEEYSRLAADRLRQGTLGLEIY